MTTEIEKANDVLVRVTTNCWFVKNYYWETIQNIFIKLDYIK